MAEDQVKHPLRAPELSKPAGGQDTSAGAQISLTQPSLTLTPPAQGNITLAWKGLKAKHGKGQAGQQQPHFGTGKVTENPTGGNFWFSGPKQTFPV